VVGVSLPVAVDEHSASATYNNGILEVTFDPAEETSTSIDI
jgi:HSP20 family protein